MSKILRNPSSSVTVSVNDTGVSINSNSSYTIPPQDYLLWAASSNVITYIGSAALIVNDGSFDLTISAGTDLIKGIFSDPEVSSPNIVNVPVTSAGTEYAYTFPIAVKRFQLYARLLSQVQLAYISGQTGSNYVTISPGFIYLERNLKPASAITIYAQATKSSEVLEIVYWI